MDIYKTAYEYTCVRSYVDTGDVDEQTLKDTLAAIEDTAENQIVQIAKIIKNLNAELTVVNDEKRRLENRGHILTKNIEYLKKSVFDTMQTMEIKKIDDPIFKISIRNNAPAVHVVDQDKIPEKYFSINVETKLDRKKVKEDIASGIAIEGVKLERKKSLQIK